ncbi:MULTISPECIES: hypothetical protein [unclassified Mycobacterium]|uniref:hypothetical protein n=1 Tax=unclassified Mycobacterium TaxID=2642494 RepID=UPI0007402BD1|nr:MULTISPECIES: hypothetical protein [unclassified Mycobacterium]KUH88223.1 hypothetical protein AU185_17865 [Mycobacterium sp. GA-0227b]
MRLLAAVPLAAAVLAMAPSAAAEPGVWPDCDPHVPEAIAECSMPPSGACAPPAIDDYSGLNGGAFVCAASGQWAWRSMTYAEWQNCHQIVLQGKPC